MKPLTTTKLHFNHILVYTMKKTAFIAALCAFSTAAMAGEKSRIAEAIVPETTTPIVAPAAATPCIAVELAGAWNVAPRPYFKEETDKINSWGIDLTAIYNLTENHGLTFRFGYGHGSERTLAYDVKQNLTLDTFNLMPGYRFTLPVNDTVKVFAGLNVGLVNHALRVREVDMSGNEPDYRYKAHGSSWGLGASVEVGASVAITENVYLFAAYQYSGSSARAKSRAYGETDGNVHRQYYHSARVGVGFQF